MSFSSSWLTLREPYDRRARNATVLNAVSALAADRQSAAMVDLACGLGSTLRATGIIKPAVGFQVLSVFLNIVLAPLLIFGIGPWPNWA